MGELNLLPPKTGSPIVICENEMALSAIAAQGRHGSLLCIRAKDVAPEWQAMSQSNGKLRKQQRALGLGATWGWRYFVPLHFVRLGQSQALWGLDAPRSPAAVDQDPHRIIKTSFYMRFIPCPCPVFASLVLWCTMLCCTIHTLPY